MVPAGRCPRFGVERASLSGSHFCLSGVSGLSGRGLDEVGLNPVVCAVMCEAPRYRVGGRVWWFRPPLWSPAVDFQVGR